LSANGECTLGVRDREACGLAGAGRVIGAVKTRRFVHFVFAAAAVPTGGFKTRTRFIKRYVGTMYRTDQMLFSKRLHGSVSVHIRQVLEAASPIDLVLSRYTTTCKIRTIEL